MIYAVYARDPRRSKLYCNVTGAYISTGGLYKYEGTYNKKWAVSLAIAYKNQCPGDKVKIISIRRNKNA